MSNKTRSRLISAAEELLAKEGVASVSLREISRASGSKNAVALQYHFGDRSGVVQAILEKHLPEVDARRNAMLDEIVASGSRDIRVLTAALVRPLAAKLSDPAGGREFIQIYADLVMRPSPLFPLISGRDDSLTRWRELIASRLPPDTAQLHRRFTVVLHAVAELSRRARSGPHVSDALFTSYVIDVLAAILGAPLSDETRRLLTARARARMPRGATSTEASFEDESASSIEDVWSEI